MIPYFPQPTWTLGPFTIHAFGLAVALALLSSYYLTLHRAPAFGLSPGHASNLFLISTLSGLAAATLIGRPTHSFSGTGLALGAALPATITALRTRSWPLLDLFACVFPLQLALARIGCFLSHDHPGRPTTSFLGVPFPTTGTRFDLGLLYSLAAFAVAVFIVVPLTRPKQNCPPGFLFAAVVASLSLTRLLIVRLDDPVSLTDQLVATAAFLAGSCLILKNRPRENAGFPRKIGV